MAFSLPQFDARRARSYLFRLPLCTRGLLAVIIAFYIASLVFPWFQQWAALIPSEIGVATLYRLNTYPLLHAGFFHLILNFFALAPLLERFEAENGTIVTFLLFTGPFGLLPGLLYTFIERFIFRGNTSVQGASIWVFLLLAVEAVKTYRTNPHFAIGPYQIPTWCTPMIAIFFISVLIPSSSLIGHMCGAAIGYAWGFGYARFLVPSEKILGWIEAKLNLLGRLPHYVSVDQKTYGRYGVLPTTATTSSTPLFTPNLPSPGGNGVSVAYTAGTQRLGP